MIPFDMDFLEFFVREGIFLLPYVHADSTGMASRCRVLVRPTHESAGNLQGV